MNDTEIYYYEGEPVYLFTYRWTDDYHYNQGYTDLEGQFVGTQKDFDEYAKAEEFGQGFCYGDLRKQYATKDQYEDMLYMIGG